MEIQVYSRPEANKIISRCRDAGRDRLKTKTICVGLRPDGSVIHKVMIMEDISGHRTKDLARGSDGRYRWTPAQWAPFREDGNYFDINEKEVK